MEYIEDMDSNTILNDSLLISETESVQTDITPLSNIGGAKCKYCPASWTRGRVQDIRTHLAMKCKVLCDLQNKDNPTLSGSQSVTLKKRKQNSTLYIDAYFNAKEAIDKDKETRANKSLIKWIVCSGISFLAFDSPYFEDFTKMLNPGYNSPKRTTLATSILDAEAANILLK
ncbi:5049_t:CDS:2, partial [Racocetra fulgida]